MGERYSRFEPPTSDRPPESKETREQSKKDVETAREALDLYLETFLEERAERKNEGNNAIILKIDTNDVSEGMQQAFRDAGLDFGQDQVAKVLKVYAPGQGRKEFEMQQRAYDLVTQHPDSTKLARVPKPLYFRDLPIGIELREKLETMGHGFKAKEHIEIFLMDEVKGDDIATALYREVVRRHPESAHLGDEVASMDIGELLEEVTRVLRFSIPGGKGKTPAERAFEEEKVNNENLRMMISWLDRKGFQVHPAVTEAITNTMQVFHENGLAFRDGHPRNFMVEGSLEASAEHTPTAYVIDFGHATTFEGKYETVRKEVFVNEAENRRYPSDDLTVNILKPLLSPPEERMTAEARAYVDELVGLMRRMESRGNEKITAFIAQLPNIIEKGAASDDSALVEFTKSPAASNIDYLLAPLATAIESGAIDTQKAHAFLQALIPKLKTDDRNKAARFLAMHK